MADYEKKQKVEEDRDERLAALVAAAVAQATVKVQERIAPIESREPGRTSVFNPDGRKDRPKLNRKIIFAGAELKERFLTNDEIEALNTLPENGTFHRGQWKLRTRESGEDKVLFVDLPVKDVNQRMDLPRGVKAIVAEIHAEASK